MNTEQILKVLKNERECIARQSRPLGEMPQCRKDEDGVKLCEYCDLCLPDTEILEVYDFLINSYELLQNEGAESYTIKCKEPLNDTELGILKGNLCDTESFTANFEPFPLPEGMIATMPDTLYKVTETPSEIRVEPTPIERLKAPFERVKENLNKAFGIKQPGKVMADFWQEGEAKLRCTNCGGELDEFNYCKECGYKLYEVTTGNDIMRQYKSMPPIGEAFEEGDTE